MSKTFYKIVGGVLLLFCVLMYVNNRNLAGVNDYLLERITAECPAPVGL